MDTISKRASDLLEKYEMTNAFIDLEKICKELGINIHIMNIDPLEKKHGRQISGALFIADGRKDIIVNEKDVPERQRFTIAHELGHYFLHHDSNSETDAIISFRGERNNLEFQADQFAAELLMPPGRLKEEYKKLSVPSISALAKKFNVSNAAMHYRLDTLGMDYIRL